MQDNEQLYTEAGKLGMVLNSCKKQRLAELRQEIVTTCGVSDAELEDVCKSAAAYAAIEKLQEQMEILYLTTQRRHANIQQTSSRFGQVEYVVI